MRTVYICVFIWLNLTVLVFLIAIIWQGCKFSWKFSIVGNLAGNISDRLTAVGLQWIS